MATTEIFLLERPGRLTPKRRKGKKMKRVGGLWDSFISLDNAIAAVYNGTQNKRTDYVVCRKLGYQDDLPEHQGKLNPAKVRKYAESRINDLRNG